MRRYAESSTACGDIDGRLEAMDALGIDVSLGAFGMQDVVDPAAQWSWSRRANDALAEIVREHPTRLTGLAALPMHESEAGGAELDVP